MVIGVCERSLIYTLTHGARGERANSPRDCYCGCCAALPAKHGCTAPIGQHGSFKTDLCRSTFCTKDPDQSLKWNDAQWQAFCTSECLPTQKTPEAVTKSGDKSCRPKECVDEGVIVRCK